MITIHQKHQIIDSLNSMNQAQMEKVLQYVKSVINTGKEASSYEHFKQNALIEIRKALETR